MLVVLRGLGERQSLCPDREKRPGIHDQVPAGRRRPIQSRSGATIQGISRGLSPNPVSIATLPPNPNDHTPPNTPANLQAFGYGDLEFQLWWTQSTDDFDRHENIRYDVYLNGHLEEVRFGSGFISSIYGVSGENTIEVIASDTAGNASPPATTTLIPTLTVPNQICAISR